MKTSKLQWELKDIILYVNKKYKFYNHLTLDKLSKKHILVFFFFSFMLDLHIYFLRYYLN